MPGVPAAVRGDAGRSRSAVSRRAGSPRQVVLHYDALFAAELVRAAAVGALLDAALRSGGAAAVGAARVLRHTARGECGRAARGPAALGGCGAARPRRRPLSRSPISAGALRGAVLLPRRLRLRREGGRERHVHVPLPPRLLPQPRRVRAPPGPRPALPVGAAPPNPPTPRAAAAQRPASPHRCPAGSDVWFVGLRCERRVTLAGLLGAAAGALLGVVLLGIAVGAAVVRRFRALLREARAEQGRSRWVRVGAGRGAPGDGRRPGAPQRSPPAATAASAARTRPRPRTGRARGPARAAPWTTPPSAARRSSCTCTYRTTAAAAAGTRSAPRSARSRPPADTGRCGAAGTGSCGVELSPSRAPGSDGAAPFCSPEPQEWFSPVKERCRKAQSCSGNCVCAHEGS